MNKKIFLIFILAFLFTASVYAKEKKSLNMWHSIGISADIISARFNTSAIAPQNGIFYSPGVGIKYEFGLLDFSFGADLSFKAYVPLYNFNYITATNQNVTKRSISNIGMSVKFIFNANYYFYNTVHYKWYVGAYFGVGYDFGESEKRNIQLDASGNPQIVGLEYKKYQYVQPYFGVKLFGFRYETKSGFFIDVVLLSLGFPLEVSFISPITLGYRFNLY